jgi:outer membrane receptor protein involved in Fe transport
MSVLGLSLAGLWRTTLLVASALLLSSLLLVRADSAVSYEFKIEAQPLAAALVEFSQQASIQVVGATAAIGDVQTSGLTGHYTAAEALERLLRNTGLVGRWIGARTVTIAAPGTNGAGITQVPPGVLDIKVPFSIAAEDISQALQDFETQGKITVKYSSRLARGKTCAGISGLYSPREALTALLVGSGLVAVPKGSNGFEISLGRRTTAAHDVGAAPPIALGDPSSEHVLVEGERVSTYEAAGNVDITRTINDEQPYYIFDSETIEESGALTVEDFLKQRLTMNTSEVNNNQVYGPGSPLGNTSSIDLRGLNTAGNGNETLILVDGRRMAGVNYQGTPQQPDINGIPLAAIDRIEVLPSSAAAIYGASAIGGIINIILKKNYNGGDFKYSYEQVTSGSAPISSVDGSYGSSAEGGKTHIMITGHYGKTEPLHVEDREGLVEEGINTILKANPSLIYNGFSPFYGGSTPNITSATYGPNGPVPLTLLNGTSLNSIYSYVCPGTSPTTSAAALNSCLLANAGKQNTSLAPGVGTFGLQEPLGYSQTTESAMLTVRREMNNWLEGFVETAVEVNNGSSVYNPVVDSGQTFYVPAGTPGNPFQQSVQMTLPSAAAFPLSANSVNRSATLGFTAHLPSNWTAETDYTWSQNSFSNHYYQFDSFDFEDNVNQIPPIPGPLYTGAVNPFVDTIAYPLNYKSYLAPVSYGSASTLNDIALRATGSIPIFSWGGPTAAIGLEHRAESYPSSTLSLVYPNTNNIADNDITYLKQVQSTDSVYAETDIPLVGKNSTIPGVRALEFQLAGRIERYSVDAGTSSVSVIPYPYGGGPPAHCYSPSLDAACQIALPRSVSTYDSSNGTLGLRYKPIDDVTVRASIGTAFLPPTFSQLLPNPQVNTTGETITDPKTGATYQVSTIGGGNPNLMPEHDKNSDIGLIYQPISGVLEGFRVDLEFFEMLQFDAIGGLNGDQILAIPQLASRVTRNPNTGLITQINERLLNLSEQRTDGWDLSIDYRLSTSAGTFEFIGAGSLLEHQAIQDVVGGPFYEIAGEAGNAKAKINGSLTWRYRQWKVGWTTEWYDSYTLYGITYQDGQRYRVPTQLYHDVFASYAFGKKPGSLFSDLTLQLGVKDIFNTAPPFDPSVSPFYVSPYGDLRMRDIWLSIRKTI